jgi:hypothetical protein
LWDSSLGVDVDSGVVDVNPVGLTASTEGAWAVSTGAPEVSVFVPFTPAAANAAASLPPFILVRQNLQTAPAAAETPATTPTTIPAMAPLESLVFLLGLFEPNEPSEPEPEPEPDDPDDPPDEPPDDPPDSPDEELVGFGDPPAVTRLTEELGILLLLPVELLEAPGISPSRKSAHISSLANCASIQSRQLPCRYEQEKKIALVHLRRATSNPQLL